VEAQLTGLARRSRLHSIQLSKECTMQSLMHQRESSEVQHRRVEVSIGELKTHYITCHIMYTTWLPVAVRESGVRIEAVNSDCNYHVTTCDSVPYSDVQTANKTPRQL